MIGDLVGWSYMMDGRESPSPCCVLTQLFIEKNNKTPAIPSRTWCQELNQDSAATLRIWLRHFLTFVQKLRARIPDPLCTYEPPAPCDVFVVRERRAGDTDFETELRNMFFRASVCESGMPDTPEKSDLLGRVFQAVQCEVAFVDVDSTFFKSRYSIFWFLLLAVRETPPVIVITDGNDYAAGLVRYITPSCSNHFEIFSNSDTYSARVRVIKAVTACCAARDKK